MYVCIVKSQCTAHSECEPRAQTRRCGIVVVEEVELPRHRPHLRLAELVQRAAIQYRYRYRYIDDDDDKKEANMQTAASIYLSIYRHASIVFTQCTLTL